MNDSVQLHNGQLDYNFLKQYYQQQQQQQQQQRQLLQLQPNYPLTGPQQPMHFNPPPPHYPYPQYPPPWYHSGSANTSTAAPSSTNNNSAAFLAYLGLLATQNTNTNK